MKKTGNIWEYKVGIYVIIANFVYEKVACMNRVQLQPHCSVMVKVPDC